MRATELRIGLGPQNLRMYQGHGIEEKNQGHRKKEYIRATELRYRSGPQNCGMNQGQTIEETIGVSELRNGSGPQN